MSVFGLIDLVKRFNDIVGDDPFHNNDLTVRVFAQILSTIRENKQIQANQERIYSTIQQGEKQIAPKQPKGPHPKYGKGKNSVEQSEQQYTLPPPYANAAGIQEDSKY
jgi:hypothetical protein